MAWRGRVLHMHCGPPIRMVQCSCYRETECCLPRQKLKAKTMRMSRWYLIELFLISTVIAAAQSSVPVSEIKLHSDPEDNRVRPFESISLQVRAYGEIEDAGGSKKKVRLREDGSSVKLSDSKAGWLSKPFRFQGKDDEPFHQKESAGLGAILLSQAQSLFLLQDAVLFTAADRPGKYEVKAELNGKKASMEIRGDRNAPSRVPREKISFHQETASRDPYRELVEHYAPMIAQETWFQPKSDYLSRVDLDGDWRGDNNWKNTLEGSSQAYVYYAVMETDTHWFLVYNFFHPRDYSDRCVAGTCHENDNEGLILTVAKDGSKFGRLQVMESLAHNKIYSYRLDRSVKKSIHNFDGDIELYDNSHPIIFIEAGGHGVYGSDDSHSKYSVRNDRFATTGVTYIYKGVAERPKHTNDRKVGYELLSIYDHWWKRAHEGRGKEDRTFDAYYRYEPYGNRPRPRYPKIAGAFLRTRRIIQQSKALLGLARRSHAQEEGAGHWTMGARSGLRYFSELAHAGTLLVELHVQSISGNRRNTFRCSGGIIGCTSTTAYYSVRAGSATSSAECAHRRSFLAGSRAGEFHGSARSRFRPQPAQGRVRRAGPY